MTSLSLSSAQGSPLLTSRKGSVIPAEDKGTSNRPPAAFASILSKAQAQDEAQSGRSDCKVVNNRLLHSLFLSNVDAEEVVSVVSEFDPSFGEGATSRHAKKVTIENDGIYTAIEMSIKASEAAVLQHKRNARGSAKIIGRKGGDPPLSAVESSFKLQRRLSSSHPSPIGDSELPPLASASPSPNPSRVNPTSPNPNPTHKPSSPSVSSSSSFDGSVNGSPSSFSSSFDGSVNGSPSPGSPNVQRRASCGYLPSLDGRSQKAVSEDVEQKYFGSAAKKDFYDQYRAMNRQRLIFSGSESAALSSSGRSLKSRQQQEMEHVRSLLDSDGASSALSASAGGWAGEDFDLFDAMDSGLLLQYQTNYFGRPGQSPPTTIHSPTSNHPTTGSALFSQGGSQGGSEADVFSGSSGRTAEVANRSNSSSDMNNNNNNNDALSLSSAVTEASFTGDPAHLSPRTAFIGGCIREGLAPLPKLVLRSNLSTKLDLSNCGFGDELGRVLSEAIHDLPHIEAVNLAGNALTDKSLSPLVESLQRIPTLLELDLSRNKIDGACSESLAQFLGRAECPLVRLVLQSADVDDGECYNFVQALATNVNLTELDLSRNKLGSSEALKAVNRDVPTGGEAVAIYLKSSSCRLESLKLAWNSIRSQSAVTLAESLAHNATLTFLDLSYNGLGPRAGEVLGNAIMENKTLRTLLLANNNITSPACFTICVAVVENLSMKLLSLSENPIGVLGSKALMQIPVLCGTRIDVKAQNCNTGLTDDSCWFDHSFPCRSYSLDLSREFERAVAFSVLQIAATHGTYIIAAAAYNGQKLSLVPVMSRDREQYFSDRERTTQAGLQRALDAASNEEKARQLFLQADRDASGSLDKQELLQVLAELGLEGGGAQLQQLLDFFDVDGVGAIGMEEFALFLRSQAKEARQRLKEMGERPVLCLEGGRSRYLPPKCGVLALSLVDGYAKKKIKQTVSRGDQENALAMAKAMGDVNLLNAALANAKIRYEEAVEQFAQLYKVSGNLTDCVARVVPLIGSAADTRRLISHVTRDEPLALSQVKRALGCILKPVLGALNGYYSLNLAKDLDRLCLSRLFEHCMTFNGRRKTRSSEYPPGYGVIGDVSQEGNWSSFRNCAYNGSPTTLSPETFSPIPKSGVVDFDFSCNPRPEPQELILTDDRVVSILANKLCLLHTAGGKNVPYGDDSRAATDAGKRSESSQQLPRPTAEALAARLRAMAASGLRGEKSGFECSLREAKEQSSALDAFYDNLAQRRAQYAGAAAREEVAVDFVGLYAAGFPGLALDARARTLALLWCDRVSPHAKAARMAELIEATLGRFWLRSRHLAVLAEAFCSIGATPKTESFGTYTVDVVVALFGRVADLQNFELVLSVLQPAERAAVIARVGWLSVFNPCKPDGAIELRLHRREERLIAKMLLVLADIEPGTNLPQSAFQWDRGTEGIGGFVVTEPWMTEEGMPDKGILTLTYYSGEGEGKRGCSPHAQTRRALLALTLVSESDYLCGEDAAPSAAVEHMRQYRSKWSQYLAPHSMWAKAN